MLGFVIFALVALVGLLITLTIMFWPTSRKEANEFGIPGDFPSDKKTGNAPDITAAGSIHEYLVGLHARHGSLAAFYVGEQLVVSVASPKLFVELKSTFNRPAELFKLYEPLFTPHSLTYLNGEAGQARHRHLRAAFQGESLQGFYGLFTSIASGYIEKYQSVPSGQHVNITRDMFHLAMSSFARAAFGDFFSQASRLDELRNAYDVCWDELEQRLDLKSPSAEREAAFDRSRKVLRDLVQRCIEQRQASSAGDSQRLFIDRLLSEDRPDEETFGEAVTFLVGGLHTTAYLLVWSLYHLASNKKIQEKVAAEAVAMLGTSGVPTMQNISDLKYTKQVVDETLRCSVLAPWAARFFDVDTELGGCTVPAKVPVVVAIGVVLQDVTIWPQPKRFDPDRFSADAVKTRAARGADMFGLAGRKCPGFQFANTEAVMVLSLLCRQFRFNLVPGPDVTQVHGLITRPSRDIEVTVEKR